MGRSSRWHGLAGHRSSSLLRELLHQQSRQLRRPFPAHYTSASRLHWYQRKGLPILYNSLSFFFSLGTCGRSHRGSKRRKNFGPSEVNLNFRANGGSSPPTEGRGLQSKPRSTYRGTGFPPIRCFCMFRPSSKNGRFGLSLKSTPLRGFFDPQPPTTTH